MTERQNAQLVTCGIFYCRDSAEINDCGSLQTSSRFDSDVLRSRQQKHTAVRCAQFLLNANTDNNRLESRRRQNTQ